MGEGQCQHACGAFCDVGAYVSCDSACTFCCTGRAPAVVATVKGESIAVWVVVAAENVAGGAAVGKADDTCDGVVEDLECGVDACPGVSPVGMTKDLSRVQGRKDTGFGGLVGRL